MKFSRPEISKVGIGGISSPDLEVNPGISEISRSRIGGFSSPEFGLCTL